jgi:hypothetical protein
MRLLIYFVLVGAIFACEAKRQEAAGLDIYPFSDSIRYTGRIKRATDSVAIFWPGTSVMIRFNGTGLKAKMMDQHGENYFNVIIDHDSLHYFRLQKSKTFYTLAENLPEGEHTIELIKRTEWDKGNTWFYGFQIDGEILSLPEPNNRIIEFFGNSITAGYAIEDPIGDNPDSIYTNNYYTYAAITARHFKADLYATVKSGIGITISWFPLIMPEMYDRLDPQNPSSKWNFGTVTPNIVVINLFQNDSWLVKMPNHESFKQRFGNRAPDDKYLIEAYRSFVEKVRKVYPNAYIICSLGCMEATKKGSPWPGYVSAAVSGLRDKKIMTHFFPYSNKPFHPKKRENEVMAESLIAFINDNIKW